MPSYRFIGAYPRFYPSIQDAEGKSLMAELGDVVDFDGPVPEDGQWVLVESDSAGASNQPDQGADMGAPAEQAPAGPEPAVQAVEPEPASEVASPASEPAPVVSEPTPEPAPRVQLSQTVSATQAAAVQPWTFPGLAPFARH